MNRQNENDWVNDLFDSVKNVRCKIKGKPDSFDNACKRMTELLDELRTDNRMLWWVGNGGSSTICSHLSQDVMNKLDIRSCAFSDVSLLTCMANDYGFPDVYARPLKKMAEEGDMLIAISSSGNSENILNSVKIATEKNMSIITLSGFNDDNHLWNSSAEISFYLSSDLYGIVEVGHLALLHSIIEIMLLNERQDKSN